MDNLLYLKIKSNKKKKTDHRFEVISRNIII